MILNKSSSITRYNMLNIRIESAQPKGLVITFRVAIPIHLSLRRDCEFKYALIQILPPRLALPCLFGKDVTVSKVLFPSIFDDYCF